MFTVVEPKAHELQKALIDPILALIKASPILSYSFQNHEKATFIVSQDKTNLIYGGALLLKQEFSSLHKKIRKHASNISSRNGDLWTCTICLHMDNNNLPQDFESFCEIFYRDLYEKLL